MIVTLPELIVPFVPLIVTALSPVPAFTIPVVPLILIAVLPEPNVTSSFKPTVYVLALVTLSMLSSTLMFLPSATFVLAADALLDTSFNCAKFTASLSIVPRATLVILLPPLSKPDLVRDTDALFVAPLLIVTPLEVTFVSPTVTLFKPLRSFAKRTFKSLEPSDTTPILSSAVNLEASVMPPLTLTCSPSFLLITLPESAPNFMPLLINSSLVLNNWLPLIASLDVAVTAPSFTFVIVVPSAPSNVTLVLSTTPLLMSYLTARSVNLSTEVLDAMLLIVTCSLTPAWFLSSTVKDTSPLSFTL